MSLTIFEGLLYRYVCVCRWWFERRGREFQGSGTGVVSMWVGKVPVYVSGIGAN